MSSWRRCRSRTSRFSVLGVVVEDATDSSSAGDTSSSQLGEHYTSRLVYTRCYELRSSQREALKFGTSKIVSISHQNPVHVKNSPLAPSKLPSLDESNSKRYRSFWAPSTEHELASYCFRIIDQGDTFGINKNCQISHQKIMDRKMLYPRTSSSSRPKIWPLWEQKSIRILKTTGRSHSVQLTRRAKIHNCLQSLQQTRSQTKWNSRPQPLHIKILHTSKNLNPPICLEELNLPPFNRYFNKSNKTSDLSSEAVNREILAFKNTYNK